MYKLFVVSLLIGPFSPFSPNMLKLCGEVVLAPLANLITRSFAEGKVPEGWKEARVVPVHKKGQSRI
jgi:hypothetical protein